VKLWIIYKDGIGFSKIIAEMLQDRLEDYINVSVGSAKKIDPAYLVEEKLDYLIIGDNISDAIPSLEIQNWLLKYWEISKKSNLIIKAISGFYVTLPNISVEPFWIEFLQDNVNAEKIFPPILNLKFNIAELVLEDGTLELVKEYTKEFIEFLINVKPIN
jgi:hypothetical protein